MKTYGSSKRGQGSTEYLVILAVVLIVALVVIALLGFFPGMAGNAKITQSQSYWAGATPLGINNVKISGTAVNMNVVNQLSNSITVTAISFNGGDLGVTSTNFGAGQNQIINGTLGATCGASGTQYEYTVVITYNQGGINGKTEVGQKTLVGQCT